MYFLGNFNAQFPQSIFSLCSTHSKEILKRGCLHNLGNCKRRDSIYPETQRSDLHSGDESNSVHACLGTSVFPRRKNKCHGILGEGGLETGRNLRNRTRPRRGFILQRGCHPPIKVLPPWPEERGAWCPCRNYAVTRPPHTDEARSLLLGCPAWHLPPPGKQTARLPQVWEAPCTPRPPQWHHSEWKTWSQRPTEVSPAVFPLLLGSSCADRGREGKTHEPHKKGRWCFNP